MTWQIWAILVVVAVAGGAFLWLRLPVYQWYCRRCRKIASCGRLHPGKCSCSTNALVAYLCQDCGSWNTSPAFDWHCNDCSSKDVKVGVEYQFASAFWRWRNQGA